MKRLLYTARWPIIVVGAAILTVGVAVGEQTGDMVAPAIGLAGLVVTIGRLLLCTAFDRSLALRPLDVVSARRWERRLAVGVIATGLCVGGFAVRCFLLPDLTTHMVAGGLVFGGDANGRFVAYDDRTGKVLWETNLGAPVGGYPIAFAVNGRQYVAVSTGTSNVGTAANRMTPELKPGSGSNLFVFALPDNLTRGR